MPVPGARRRAWSLRDCRRAVTLLKDLGTLAYNITHTNASPDAKIVLTTRPTPLQTKAFELLALNPACTQ